jgi:geranylgeranyl diphosphate synthase type II
MEKRMRNRGAFDLKEYLGKKREVVDTALQGYLPETQGPAADLVRAMRYSLFAGGKRLRPILCLAAAEAVGGKDAEALPVACALEMIHTYSLIHDDLPVMDDDDLRRGKPTSHKVFGEALALLAGDALLTEAFRVMTSAPIEGSVSPRLRLRAVDLISRAAGREGMVGGQVVDIQSEGKTVDFPTVETMHNRKTGALIRASVTTGALLGGGTESQISCLSTYGKKIGLAFQISDDILDIEGDSETLGKTVGADEQRGKMTYPALIGLEKSKEIRAGLVQAATESLKGLDGRAEPLRVIARYIIERKK